MTDKKLTDNEIKKALECRVKDKCPECPYFHGYPCDKCRNMQTDALDLINRLQAENERLRENNKAIMQTIADVHTEAYKEFAEQVQGEIDDAIHSNYNAKEERQEKCKKFGIPIAPEDSFLMYCDGKIHALSGLQSFICNLLKELVGGHG